MAALVGCLLALAPAAVDRGTPPVQSVLWQQTHQSVVRSMTTGVLPATASRAALPVMLIGSQRSGGTGDEDVEAIHARNGSLFWSSTDLKQWSYSVALQPEVASKTAGETQRGVAGFGCPFSGHAAAWARGGAQ